MSRLELEGPNSNNLYSKGTKCAIYPKKKAKTSAHDEIVPEDGTTWERGFNIGGLGIVDPSGREQQWWNLKSKEERKVGHGQIH